MNSLVRRTGCVGKSIPRLDGVCKVTGRAKYVDDIVLPDMWHGAVVRSQIPHGKVGKIEFLPSFDWKNVVIADHKDIPGKNYVAMIEQDVPLIVNDSIKHIGEAVLLIAAPTRELAYEARKHVKVEYEEWTPVLTIEDAKNRVAKIKGEDNIIADYCINDGDIKAGFKKAHKIVEGVYRVPHQEHVYIETNGAIAIPRADGGLDIVGSLQCPYYVLNAMMLLTGLPAEKLSIRQATVGGAFGGKEDYPSILAGYCAVLAMKCGRPVKIVYDRVEDMEVTTRRHPAVIRHKTGVAKDGRLVAMDILVEMDAGAYATMTPVVLSRGLIHSTGPYRCPNVRARGVAYATNTPPNGAFRGFGVPQVAFAVEAHIDRIALELGISPLELRRKSCFIIGDETATGQKLKESVATLRVLEEAASISGFERKHEEYHKAGKTNARKGIGMALFWHGAAFTGSGEDKIKARAGLRLNPDGKIVVLVAATEMGQGAHTVLPQIVADELGVDISCVTCEMPDTSRVPNSGPTVASRTTMIVGATLCKCARALKTILGEFAGGAPIDAELVMKYVRAHHPDKVRFEEEFKLPPEMNWDDATYKGDAYPAYAWGCDVAEVEVDMDTFETKVVKMWMVQDIGKAVNPRLAEGQIEGGTLQTVGYGLMENFQMKDGKVVTNRLQTYLIPTMQDTPEFETIIIEEPSIHGPMGAKGLGELPMDGGAPAIVNAIRNATGLDMNELPATPERMFEKFKHHS